MLLEKIFHNVNVILPFQFNAAWKIYGGVLKQTLMILLSNLSSFQKNQGYPLELKRFQLTLLKVWEKKIQQRGQVNGCRFLGINISFCYAGTFQRFEIARNELFGNL